jgi:hypothetical protein
MNGPHESEEFKRHAVPSNLQPQLRLYRRLYLARIDLNEAKATVEELLDRRIPLPRSKLPSALLMSLTTALVVAYARPFVNSRGQSEVADKAVPGVLLRVFTSTERELHEALLDIRNKEVAHSDADMLDMSIKLYKDGEGAIFRNARAPFHRRALKAILRMTIKLEVALEQRCTELRTELPLNAWL